jgi:hypothetical protein
METKGRGGGGERGREGRGEGGERRGREGRGRGGEGRGKGGGKPSKTSFHKLQNERLKYLTVTVNHKCRYAHASQGKLMIEKV